MNRPTQPADRHNVRVLACSQALMVSAVVLSMTLAAMLGSLLAPDPGLATLPVAALVIGTTLASIPASMFMRRHGRRAGFAAGAMLGLAGSATIAWGLGSGSFALFVAGHLLLGSYQGVANYYRFAAVEATGPRDAARAIAWVVAAGVVAAFAGPRLAFWGRDWIVGHAFVGSYVAQGLLSVLALMLIARLRLPSPPSGATEGARPLRVVAAQPAIRAAVVGMAAAHAVMIMAMTATPLAMLGHGMHASDVGPVIQWHVVGMFAPSFFTGTLVKRFGASRVMLGGFMLLLGHVAVAVSGIDLAHFVSALVLLGVGWNFAFIGGTALLTQNHRPSEQGRVQAMSESFVSGLVALASLSAGWIHQHFGWVALNAATLPLLLLAVAAIVGVDRQRIGALRPA